MPLSPGRSLPLRCAHPVRFDQIMTNPLGRPAARSSIFGSLGKPKLVTATPSGNGATAFARTVDGTRTQPRQLSATLLPPTRHSNISMDCLPPWLTTYSRPRSGLSDRLDSPCVISVRKFCGGAQPGSRDRCVSGFNLGTSGVAVLEDSSTRYRWLGESGERVKLDAIANWVLPSRTTSSGFLSPHIAFRPQESTPACAMPPGSCVALAGGSTRTAPVLNNQARYFMVLLHDSFDT